MKFEIDPNELTTEQRTHVATFITSWPSCGNQLFTGVTNDLPIPRNAHSIKEDAHGLRFTIPKGEALLKRAEPFEQHAAVKYEHVTEEQHLDAEQKSDLADIPEVNLNTIFGAPTAEESPGTYAQTLERIPSVPLDKEGLPWDSRIHASTKTFIADGTWKLRRGVDPAEVATVKAQLKELMAVPSFVNIDEYAPNDVIQAMVTDLHRGAEIVPADDIVHSTGHVDYDPSSRIPITPAPVLTPTSVGYVPVPPAPKSHYLIDQQPEVVEIPLVRPPSTVTLTELIGRMSAAIAAGKLTQANVTEMCAKHGVSEFMLLSSRPDLLPLIDADMKAMGV